MPQFPTINQVVYKDFDTLFDIHPVTRKLNVLTNDDAIVRSVKNLVLTNKGERPYQPFLGCDIRNRLFEPADDGFTEEEIVENIEEVIGEYEPRAELIDVIADVKPDQNSVNVTITFRAINATEPTTLNLILEKVR
jgi:phage baseplate assembly protein W|tara:strand:+ start:618 stop:1025 length:408 start_codon:yes stop_codon:yes gene_type:complete